MNDAKLLDAGAVETLKGANPELEVGVDRVLDEDGHIRSAESVGNLLNSEGVGGGACAHPYHVDAVLDGLVDVLRRGDLDSGVHASLFLDPLEPRQTDRAYALERAWACAWFPDAGAENLDAVGGEFACRVHYLLLSLGAARSSYNEGSFAVHAREEDGLEFELCFHCIIWCLFFSEIDGCAIVNFLGGLPYFF